MPFSVAAQRGVYMVVYGVTQKDIQFIVFDRANMGGDIIPQDPVALLNVGDTAGSDSSHLRRVQPEAGSHLRAG